MNGARTTSWLRMTQSILTNSYTILKIFIQDSNWSFVSEGKGLSNRYLASIAILSSINASLLNMKCVQSVISILILVYKYFKLTNHPLIKNT